LKTTKETPKSGNTVKYQQLRNQTLDLRRQDPAQIEKKELDIAQIPLTKSIEVPKGHLPSILQTR